MLLEFTEIKLEFIVLKREEGSDDGDVLYWALTVTEPIEILTIFIPSIPF